MLKMSVKILPLNFCCSLQCKLSYFIAVFVANCFVKKIPAFQAIHTIKTFL